MLFPSSLSFLPHPIPLPFCFLFFILPPFTVFHSKNYSHTKGRHVSGTNPGSIVIFVFCLLGFIFRFSQFLCKELQFVQIFRPECFLSFEENLCLPDKPQGF